METLIRIMLQSGKAGIDVALYTLLPVLVILMAVMKAVESRGILALVARWVEPLLKRFGVPGAGAFAIVQLLFVSFAAPLATLAVMEKDGTPRRAIAATLAMVLTMSQANVIYPMAAAGLNVGVILLTSLAGGLAAAALTYFLFTRTVVEVEPDGQATLTTPYAQPKGPLLTLMIQGGQEAVQVILGAIPMLILAIFLVNCLKATGSIALLERALSPVLGRIGFPPAAVLPLATKYLAGGTAMMGVTLNLMKEGAITPLELNRMAGFLTNPCDLVGVAVLISAGVRCASVVRPAVAGAVVGILLRGVMHLIIF